MAGIWYRAGTVAVTNGSKKVVGTGTTWKSGTSKPDKGHTVWAPDGKAYELDYVESDSSLYLVTAYSGVTVSGAAYAIDISRSGTNSAFSRDLSAFVAYHQLQMDGWQQLLTGTGDVTLTAPDGTKLTVPSWEKIMNAGTGVVAQAKTEAQNAAASAASAGNAVVAAALPLPDVWAPLSDSLRLITGYGRDVLVGSDVVARMVNFSRSTTATYIGKDGQLKTAAANEPRFEREGLLIEGQSTNYIPKSEYYDDYAKTNVTVSGKVLTRSVITGESYLNLGAYNLPSGKITVSAAYKKSSAVNFDFFNVYCARFTPNASNLPKVKEVGDLVIVSATFDADFSPGSAGVFFKIFTVGNGAGSVQLEYIQMESLPFASSYIPTNGAAVTRAPDICTIPNPLNLPIDAGDMTVALELRRNPLIPASSYPRVFQIGGITWLICDSTRFMWRGGTTEQWSFAKPAPGSPETVGYRINGAQVTVRCGSAVSTGTRTGPIAANSAVTNIGADTSGSNNMFGHVRNLRIWRRPLTDDQMKAIA
ncbi:hypothetical protein ACK35S_02685 [Aeromonas veronii]